MNVTLYGAASESIDRIYIDRVEELGLALANEGHTMIFGGGASGLMGAAARGMQKGKGKIIGVIPHFIHEFEPVYDGCTELIHTETMAERKDEMEGLADAFIIVPGGIGTFDELFQILTLKVLKQHDKPIILYNVPSRTNVNISPELLLRLSDCENIIGVKECNFGQVPEIYSLCGDRYALYSGEDGLAVPMISLGAKGVISVIANIMPKETSEMIHDYINGDTEKAKKAQIDFIPLVKAMFCEVNPIPVKEAMNILGWNAGPCRLPLCEMSKANHDKVVEVLAKYDTSAMKDFLAK